MRTDAGPSSEVQWLFNGGPYTVASHTRHPCGVSAAVAWESPELVGFGAGRLKALVGASVRPDLAVDMEVAPPPLRVAVSRWEMQALHPVLLGDNPIRAGVVESQSDHSAQVQRGGAVMQPVVVLMTPR
jgi:hypothetical protein